MQKRYVWAFFISFIFISYESKAIGFFSNFISCESGIENLPIMPILLKSTMKSTSSLFGLFKNSSTHSNVYLMGGLVSTAALLYFVCPYVSKFLSNRFSCKKNVAKSFSDKNEKSDDALEDEEIEDAEQYRVVEKYSLHRAVEDKDIQKVLQLLCSGKIDDVNALDDQKRTALDIAIKCANVRIAQLLVAAGATT